MQQSQSEEDEPTISVFFWSVVFVLLLIVTVWFYITQIAPAHSSPACGENEAEDKQELVAKRILEQLHVIEGTNESSLCEKQVHCEASGGEQLDAYEYVDDEIHIHYSQNAWESEHERCSTRRRHSMDEMELIFPGFLPRIIEEEGEEEGEESEDSEEQESVDSSLNKTLGGRAIVDGEANAFSVNRALFETTARKTAVVKPGSHQVTTTTVPKHIENAKVRDAKPRVTQDDEQLPVKAVEKKWRLEPVKIQENETIFLCSQGDSLARISENAFDENITAAHETKVENDQSRAYHARSLARKLDTITTSSGMSSTKTTLLDSNTTESDVHESITVFTLSNLELSPDNKQTGDYSQISNSGSKTANGLLCNGHESGKNSVCVDEKDLKSIKHPVNKGEQEARETSERSEEPTKTVEGLATINIDGNYECKMNGITSGVLEEEKVHSSPTTHAWTFFSMSETEEVSPQKIDYFAQATKSLGNFEMAEVPTIVIDSYDDKKNEDHGKQETLVPAIHAKAHSTYTSSFETDIDVDEIDLDGDLDLDEDSDFSVYFKRHVSVTDLDKILSEETLGDIEDSAINGGDIIVTRASKVDEIVNDLEEESTGPITKEGVPIQSQLRHETIEITHKPINICDGREDSAVSEPEPVHENISCSEYDVIETAVDVTTQESESPSSVTVYHLDQLLEEEQTPPDDSDEDNLETFCEELSDLIDEYKKDLKRARLFTIPEEVEVSEGVFVDRSTIKSVTFKAPVVMEPKSDSAPIATMETSDSESDLEEDDKTTTSDASSEGVYQAESLEVQNEPCTDVSFLKDNANFEDVSPKHEDIAGSLYQTALSEFVDNIASGDTEIHQEERDKQALVPKETSLVNEDKLNRQGAFVTETKERAVVVGTLYAGNKTPNAVKNDKKDIVLDCVQTHPAYELAEREDEKVKEDGEACLFSEEKHQITEVADIPTTPTLSVLDTDKAHPSYELAQGDDEEIKHEDIYSFREEEVKVTEIKSGNVDITPKREKGFRVTRVKVIRERVKTSEDPPSIPHPQVIDISAETKTTAPLCTVPAKPVSSTSPAAAKVVPVTKVTVEKIQELESEEPPKLQFETKLNSEGSPRDNLGLKIFLTGRRTDPQESTKNASSQFLDDGDTRSEGRVSPDSGRSSPRRPSLKTAEKPRKTYQSTHQIRLTKSHEDLRLLGSQPQNVPQKVIIREHVVPTEMACVQSTPSTPSPPPMIPEDEAVESVQSPNIHTAKITMTETVGNRRRITILNVQKKVTGNARWKSLNDLDSFGTPSPVTDEGSRMSSFAEERPCMEAEWTRHKIEAATQPEIRARRVESGYGSLDLGRKTPSPTTVGTKIPDQTPRTQPKETIFAISAEPVAHMRIANIEEETEESSTDVGDELLGESRVKVTDLDSVLLAMQGVFPEAEEVSGKEFASQEAVGTVVHARVDPVRETIIRAADDEGEEHRIVAYSVAKETVPLEALILPETSDTQEDAPIITAFPLNDGYEDEEIDDVFYKDPAPLRYTNNGVATTPISSDSVAEFHSSDADSETSSVSSVPLKQRHRHTRASLEASSARVVRLSDSTDSSHTPTPIGDLENDPFSPIFQTSTPDGKPSFGQSGDKTPRDRQFHSTTEIDDKSSEVHMSAFSRVGSSRMSGDSRGTRPRSELFIERAASDEDANLAFRTLNVGFQEVDNFPGQELEKQRFRDAAESRKSMPDLSLKSDSKHDSPYLRGLSAHTKRWLSQNFMSPTTFSDDDDTLGSEMFLHPTSFVNLADDGDDVSIASVSTRPQSPMSEFSFAGEVPQACQQRGARTVVKCAYVTCSREEVLIGKQKTSYTSCPACFTYYCNRDCRRVHWSEHKKVCFFGRINSYVRSFVYHTQNRENLKFLLSKVAIEAYKKKGRGCVMVTFASPQSARKFMTTGCLFFPSPPSYSCVADLKAEGVISKHKEVMLQLMKDYDPTQEFVLNLAIIAGKMENLPPEPVPRRKVNTVLQCVKTPLSDKLVDSSPKEGPGTSPETKIFCLPKCSRHEFVNEIEARRHYCRNIAKELKQYGIKLKKNHPDIYEKLCKYVEKNIHFEPQTVQGKLAGRAVKCKIMPEA